MIGFFIPLVLFAVLSALTKLNVAPGAHLITALPAFTLFLMELPGVAVGRALGLPVEIGAVAQPFYDLNAFGCVFVVMLWFLFGSLAGAMAGVVRSYLLAKSSTA